LCMYVCMYVCIRSIHTHTYISIYHIYIYIMPESEEEEDDSSETMEIMDTVDGKVEVVLSSEGESLDDENPTRDDVFTSTEIEEDGERNKGNIDTAQDDEEDTSMSTSTTSNQPRTTTTTTGPILIPDDEALVEERLRIVSEETLITTTTTSDINNNNLIFGQVNAASYYITTSTPQLQVVGILTVIFTLLMMANILFWRHCYRHLDAQSESVEAIHSPLVVGMSSRKAQAESKKTK